MTNSTGSSTPPLDSCVLPAVIFIAHLLPHATSTSTRIRAPPSPTEAQRATMDATLHEGPLHMDHASHLFGNAEGINILDRINTLERQMGEILPARLCAGLVREPVLNSQARIRMETSLSGQRNHAAHGRSFLVDL